MSGGWTSLGGQFLGGKCHKMADVWKADVIGRQISFGGKCY